MSNHVLVPPAEVIDDFPSLQANIADDKAGSKTQRLLRCFDEAAVQSQQMQLQCTDYEQKEFARLMHDAFAGAQRIVTRAWEKTHGMPLAG